MNDRTIHHDLPEHSDIEEAIYRYVGEHGRHRFGQLVEPMARHFGLSREQIDRESE